MQGQLSTLPPGGTGPALRLPLLHSYLLSLLCPCPGAGPARACLKWGPRDPLRGFLGPPVDWPTLYPLAFHLVSALPEGSSRVRDLQCDKAQEVYLAYPGVCPLCMFITSSKAA